MRLNVTSLNSRDWLLFRWPCPSRTWILISLILALAGAACGPDREPSVEASPRIADQEAAAPPAPNRIPVEATTVERSDLTHTLRLIGTAQPWDDFEVSARLSGRIARILVDQGDWVNEGDLLAELDRETLRIELEARQTSLARTEVQLEFARKNLERGEQLLARGAISQSEVDRLDQAVRVAETDVRAARIAIDSVQDQLDETRVLAPAAGKVSDRWVSTGEHVRDTEVLFKIIQLTPLKIVTEIPEPYLGQIRPGQSVNLVFESLSQEARRGQIHFIDPMGNTRTGAFPVEIRLSNPQLRIQPGMVARVELQAGTIPDALSIHSDALLENEQGTYVFVIQNERSVRKPVEVFDRVGERIVVQADLQAGDRLVTAGKMNVTEGTLVEVLP